MAGLIKQTVNGKSYYYAIETKRVNGQPRVVKKQYLDPHAAGGHHQMMKILFSG